MGSGGIDAMRTVSRQIVQLNRTQLEQHTILVRVHNVAVNDG